MTRLIFGLTILTVTLVAMLYAITRPQKFGPLHDKTAAIKAGCLVIRQQWHGTCAGLEAESKDKNWVISGSLPRGYAGGGPVVVLAKADGRLLDAYMTQ
jgi:hypothetical protein